MTEIITTSARLTLRELTVDDADFMFDLLNQPSFLEHIGDKGVRSIVDARQFITDSPRASYARHGFGLWAVQKDSAVVGLCGLLQRDYLDYPDIGFAFLPQYWSQGLAYESSQAVLALASKRFRLDRVLAIASPDNKASIGLLKKLGFEYARPVRAPGEDRDISLFTLELPNT